jgi:hypothetical protein
MQLALNSGDDVYKLIVFVHILTVVVGFGSAFVWPYLASQARAAGPEMALFASRTSLTGAKILTTMFIYTAGATGLLLLLVNDTWEFSQTWISIAFLLFFVAVGVAAGLHVPNLKAMLGLQEELADGVPGEGDTPPPQALELAERGKKAGMYGGILHLLFILLLLDMVFKPGL